MNKKLLIIVIVLLLLSVGLSGCNGIDDGAGWAADKVEIVSYSIVTYKLVEEKMANGFVYHEDAKFYMVNGTARNIAGKMLDKVTITVKFYDSNNIFLREESVPVYDVEDECTWEFEIIYLSTWDYFEDVDHIEFDISGTLKE